METASIQPLPERVHRLQAISLESRKFTPLVVGRVDSREHRRALPWCAWQTFLRGHSPARSMGPLRHQVQLTENSYIRHRLATGSPSRTRTESRLGFNDNGQAV